MSVEIEPLEPRRLLTAAFPGASGPAMNATGGRGGDVYHVTNLTDAIDPQPGSLRYGIKNAPGGGRTIVFDVGGTIQLAPNRNGWLEINRPNLTIAGQTAPGGGVTIMGNATKVTGDNIVLRHLKFRPKLSGTVPDTETNDALWLTGNNIIVDHVSTSWYDDEGISSSDSAGNLTVQYAIVGNGLNYNGHGYASIIGSDVLNSQIAYHHNLIAHNKSRIPRLGNETSVVTFAEFSNNVVYNWQSSEAGYSGGNDSNDQPIPGGQFARANFVGNTYIYGNSPGTKIFESAGTNTHIYHSGNKLDTGKNGVLKDGRDVVWSDFHGTETQIATRFNIAGMTYDTADASLDNTLNSAGAFWWARDAVDTRIVNETRTGTGNVIATANTTEWNNAWNASQVTRAAGWDTDGDGMPNAWETANGFNPNAADHNGDADGDGYSNVEEYLEYAAQGSPADAVAPTSNVAALPVITGSTSFNVAWSGSDNAGGSGIANYDVYVSTNGGAYTLWQNATTNTSATFTGAAGSQYRFYSRARDAAGNVEGAPVAPDATIRISAAPTFLVVAADGTGQHTTVQSAIDAVPATNTQPVDIYIKSGTYTEHVSIAAGKSFVTLIGQDPATTKITFNRDTTFGGGGQTFESATVTVYANDFSAENITFENTRGPGVQALAMAARGARQQFRNCRWLGWQDTLRIDTDKMYFKDCYIEGSVDFIYGDATAVFDNCQMLSKAGGYVTAASTPQNRAYGYVFLGGTLTTSGAGNDSVYLGRPWQPYASVTYINTSMDTHIHPAGWNDWGNAANQATARYAEYNSTGPGASPSTRVSWSRQLTAVEAANYTVPNILPGWTPSYYIAPAADTTAPTSSVAALPATTTASTFNVSWSGTDNAGGSGLANYDVYVSTNGAAYSLWQNATTAPSATFTGVNGSQYRFYSRARDNVGNLEPAPATPDATTTVVPELAAWWKLDETSGSSVSDSSGNAKTGTANGPAWVLGKFGNALSFDGVNDYVTLPNSIASSAAGSVAMWIKTGTNFADSGHLFYTSTTLDGNGGGSHNEVHLNFLATDQLQFFIEGGSLDVNIISPSTYIDNAWHHVAATWDINGNAVLYVDGAAVGSVAHDANNFTGSATTYLGRPAASTRYYSGLMDHVRLYNVPISASQALALYQEVPPGSLPAWLAPGSAATWDAGTKTLTVTGAASIIADPGPADAPLIVASSSAANLTINPATGSRINVGGITLSNGATATVTNAATDRVLIVNGSTLSITGASRLDLTDNDLIVKGAALEVVQPLLANGFAGGSWDGGGIVSSAAALDDRFLLGVAENGTLPLPYGTDLGGPLFAGQDVEADDVLIKFTWTSDITLDGVVDFQDLSIFNGNFDSGATSGRLWIDGDRNYDGLLDFQDLSLFNGNYDPAKPPA